MKHMLNFKIFKWKSQFVDCGSHELGYMLSPFFLFGKESAISKEKESFWGVGGVFLVPVKS